MKYIKYILIVVMLSSVVFTAIPLSKLSQRNEITLSTTTYKPDKADIKESVEIMNDRLQSYGVNDAQIEVSENENLLNISYAAKFEDTEIETLLTSPGKLEFFIVKNNFNVYSVITKNEELNSYLSILSNNDKTPGKDYFLSCKEFDLEKVMNILSDLSKNKLDDKIRFLKANKRNSENEFSIYPLAENPVMICSEKISSKANHNSYANYSSIDMQFGVEDSKLWKEITGSNILNNIAIVIDNEVIIAPYVNSQIKNGKCTISGNLTSVEAKQTASIIGSSPLPLEFKRIK